MIMRWQRSRSNSRAIVASVERWATRHSSVDRMATATDKVIKARTVEANHSTGTKPSTKGIMVVRVDLAMANLETSLMEDSELTKEEDSNDDSMGSATTVANMDTRQRRVNLSG